MSAPRRAVGSATLLAVLVLAGCASQAAEARRAPALADPAIPVELFARMDATLALAIEQSQLAARRASDVALRAFAVQQAGLYAELRTEMRRVAGGFGHAPAAPAVVPAHERLGALRVARGARFDQAYVRQALAVHRELLGDLDAALRLVDDAETRRALETLRGEAEADAGAEAAVAGR